MSTFIRDSDKSINNSSNDYVTLKDYNSSFKIYPSSYSSRMAIVPYGPKYPFLNSVEIQKENKPRDISPQQDYIFYKEYSGGM